MTPSDVPTVVSRAVGNLTRGRRLRRGVLLFIVYRSEPVRREAESLLEEHLRRAGIRVRRVRFPLADSHDWVASLAHDPPAADEVLFVHDIRRGGQALLNSLNYRREVFAEHRVRAVFWVMEQELTTLAERTPDFFRFRSEVLELPASPPEEDESLRRRIALRERLLAELEDDATAAPVRAALRRSLDELYRTRRPEADGN